MPLLDSILLLDSDFQFSTKELQSTKKQEMCVLCDPFKAMCVCVCVCIDIYINKTILEKDLMVDLVATDLNTTILKMLKKLKESIKEVKKTMSE